MSRRTIELIAIGLAGLLIIGLIAYDRGRTHYRGDEYGDHGTPVTTVVQIVP
jgi:hypothetical protein